MSRLQKKCFIGATGFHLLLLGTLIVGPVFLSPGEPDPTPVLEFLPMMTTEAKVSGGGSPRPPAPAQQPAIQQPVQQPQLEKSPEKTPPKREPDPPKVEKVKPSKPDPESFEPKREKQPHKVQVSDRVVKVNRDSKTSAKSANEATAAAAARAAAAVRKQQVAAALSHITSGLTPTTQVEMPEGPGGGGASYANYGQVVRKIYTDAWHIPNDVTDDEATVKVSVTIARSGHVISSRILQSSGSKLVDQSIQTTLDRVTFVCPFPAESKDSQKTFNISFSLKAKKIG